MTGRIIGLSCGIYSILTKNGIIKAPARGIFRNQKIKPVVGDIVDIDEKNIVIESINDRKTLLVRPSVSNIESVYIVLSIDKPVFSFDLAFKYLTYCNKFNLKTNLVITKTDLSKDNNLIEEIKATFNSLNIPVFFTSKFDKKSFEILKEKFANSISCLMGQSGVGKSSLLNEIDESYDRKIGEYSKALGRGKHQTKEVILLPYENGFIADTPGFSSLDLNLYKEEIAQFFPGFSKLFTKCFYSNCLHITENKCAVKDLLQNGLYPKRAYECYLKLSNETIFRNERYTK